MFESFSFGVIQKKALSASPDEHFIANVVDDSGLGAYGYAPFCFRLEFLALPRFRIEYKYSFSGTQPEFTPFPGINGKHRPSVCDVIMLEMESVEPVESGSRTNPYKAGFILRNAIYESGCNSVRDSVMGEIRMIPGRCDCHGADD